MTAARTGSVTYTSPRTLKNLAIAVTGAVRPEIISRSHESSRRWICASTALSAAATNAAAVRAAATAAITASRRGAARSGGSGGPCLAHAAHAA